MTDEPPVIPNPTLCEVDNVYHIGLALAGGATAGAYLGGAMDFLLEALLEWERLRHVDPTIPQWRLSLSEMAGTSAGGITTSVFIASLNSGFVPLPKDFKDGDPSPKYNPLFSVWVDEMDLVSLLSCTDISDNDSNENVKSFFNSCFMTETAKRILTAVDESELTEMPEFAKNIRFSLTNTNLRGVPYDVPNFRYAHEQKTRPQLRNHADFTTFMPMTTKTKTTDGSPNDTRRSSCNVQNYHSTDDDNGVLLLDMKCARNSEQWMQVVDCTRATSAFPIMFPTVQLKSKKCSYTGRLHGMPDWSSPLLEPGDNVTGHEKEQDQDMYIYTACDGGVVNNEPFALLKHSLQKRFGKPIPGRSESPFVDVPKSRQERKAVSYQEAAIILVDPFPGTEDPRLTNGGLSIPATLNALLNALLGQAGFRPSKLVDEDNDADGDGVDNDIMQYLLYPERSLGQKVDDGLENESLTLASGLLGGFSGALHRDLRLHDYMLGRHNMQSFLQQKFVMRCGDMRKCRVFELHLDRYEDENDLVPIIPLVGSACSPCPMPQLPRFSSKEIDETMRRVEDAVLTRADRIVGVLFNEMGVFVEARLNPLNHIRNAAACIVKSILAEFFRCKAAIAVEDTLRKFS